MDKIVLGRFNKVSAVLFIRARVHKISLNNQATICKINIVISDYKNIFFCRNEFIVHNLIMTQQRIHGGVRGLKTPLAMEENRPVSVTNVPVIDNVYRPTSELVSTQRLNY